MGLKNSFIYGKIATLMPNSVIPENFISNQHSNNHYKWNNERTYAKKELKNVTVELLYWQVQRR